MVSFGTIHKDTREKTIEVIEQEIQELMPEYELYRAFTSKIIIKMIQKKEGIRVCTVEEAMEKIHEDGIREIIVQPTHIINGVENDAMIQDVLKYKEAFDYISFGEPLLNQTEDYRHVVEALKEVLPEPSPEEAVVLMGHGTSHYTNACYAAMEYTLEHYGYDNVHIATVEAFPYIEDVIERLKRKPYKKIMLLPFMFVAGKHAKNDMIGANDDSWLNQLTKAGYEVEYLLKGLGEFPKIRSIYYEHIKNAKQVDTYLND